MHSWNTGLQNVSWGGNYLAACAITRDLQSGRDRVRYPLLPFFYENRIEFFFLLLLFLKSTLLISKIIIIFEMRTSSKQQQKRNKG